MDVRWGAKVARFSLRSWSCCCVLVAENSPRLCKMKAMNQYSRLEYELAGVVFPVREEFSGLLSECRDPDVSLKTLSQCKFAEQFRSYFSAGSQQAVQQFYMTTRKALRAVLWKGYVKGNEAVFVYGSIAPHADLPRNMR